MKKYKLKDIMSTSLYFLAVLIITFLVIKYVGQRTEVIGRSMEPTLSDGDNLIVDKFSYLFRDPERFEIIVFPYRDRPNVYYIKRVVGLPGETVEFKGENFDLYINNELVEQSFISLETQKKTGLNLNYGFNKDTPIVLDDNSLY